MNFAVNFPGKEPNEQILLVLRRHWYVVFRRIALFAFTAFVPGVALLAAGTLGRPFVFDPRNLGSILGVLALSTYELLVWIFFYVAWLDYELDVFIVTDQRIVNIAQNGLFARTVSEQRLFRVQDVMSEVKGIIPTFLRFGTVYVQTAGEQGHFIFRNVPNPEHVAKVIHGQMEKIGATMGLEMRAEMAAAAKPGATAPSESKRRRGN